MFTTPLSQVTFDQLLAFCQAFPEGVRVEYKREAANIPKVVSSFAALIALPPDERLDDEKGAPMIAAAIYARNRRGPKGGGR